MHDPSAVTTFLFTDIEGSTRLWEQDAARMRPTLARHDAIARRAVEANGGVVVKMTGDGIHAAFRAPIGAVHATLQLQQSLAAAAMEGDLELRVRCGLHVGIDERRDGDFFGVAVNRAARIMRAAHGGQVLLSQGVVDLLAGRMPEAATLRDLGSARLRDLAEPEHLYQVVHPLLRADFPALRWLEATPNNLPHALTSFIGREREVAEVQALLQQARLLTLVGMGGLGKTRLSLQAAADVIDAYPDGVWFVDLAPLRDPRLVPQAVASVLGVKEEAGRPVGEALAKFVEDRALLLILDNCEHLLAACADLAVDLLRAGPSLKILASSREHLHARGETTYTVSALAVPDAAPAIAPETLMEFASVRLLIDRARAAQPAFAVTAQNAEAVAEICRRLDGIPLAIELAAARMRTLSPAMIAQRLDDRFRLLTGGHRTDLPRQQTLRTLIDWSFDLLTQSERSLFTRLAVFAGGWTLEAAAAVGAGDDLAATEIFDLLVSLVEKSLVVFDVEGERYRLLETVREYAQEKLDESADGASTRGRHLACYLAFAERARSELGGAEQGAWLTRLDLERENILVAHAWCNHAENGGESGLRLVSLVKAFWINRGLLELGHRVTVEALERAGAQARGLTRCRSLFDAGQLCYFMGRYADANAHLTESLAIARHLGDRRRVAAVLQPLGMAALGQDRIEEARDYLEEALALANAGGDQREVAAASNALAQLHRKTGSPELAESLYAEVLRLSRELGDRENVAVGLLNLAMVAIARGAHEQARRMLIDVVAIAAEINSIPAAQNALEVGAALAAAASDWTHAARFFGMAEASARATGLRRDPTDDAFLAPLIDGARRALDTRAFDDAQREGLTLPRAQAMAEMSAWLADRRWL